MEKKRSLGIIICGLLAIIIGLLELYGCLEFYNWSSLDKELLQLDSLKLVTFIIIAISFLVSGIFILKLRNWARILFMILMVYWVIFGLLKLFIPHIIDKILLPSTVEVVYKYFELSDLLIYFIWYGLPAIGSIYFLTRPKVKEQFK